MELQRCCGARVLLELDVVAVILLRVVADRAIVVLLVGLRPAQRMGVQVGCGGRAGRTELPGSSAAKLGRAPGSSCVDWPGAPPGAREGARALKACAVVARTRAPAPRPFAAWAPRERACMWQVVLAYTSSPAHQMATLKPASTDLLRTSRASDIVACSALSHRAAWPASWSGELRVRSAACIGARARQAAADRFLAQARQLARGRGSMRRSTGSLFRCAHATAASHSLLRLQPTRGAAAHPSTPKSRWRATRAVARSPAAGVGATAAKSNATAQAGRQLGYGLHSAAGLQRAPAIAQPRRRQLESKP